MPLDKPQRGAALSRDRILAAGLDLMRRDPQGWSVRGVARELGSTHQAVMYHFASRRALWDAVAAHAVERGDGPVIAYLRAVGDGAVAG